MMTEFRSSPEEESRSGLELLIDNFFPEDSDFLAGLDEEDKLGAVYGQLLEIGEDPDEVFARYGITDGDENEV